MSKSPMPLSIKENVSWGIIGNVLYSLTQSGILIVLARLDSPDSVGTFTLALAIVAPIYMFARMQLNLVYASDLKNDYIFNDYIAVRIVSSVLMLIILLSVLTFLDLNNRVLIVVIVIACSKFVEGLSDICYGVMQKNERIDKVGISKTLRGILTISFFSFLLYLFKSLEIATLGLVISGILTLLLYDFRNTIVYQSIRPRFIWKNIYKIIIIAIPLAFFQMLLSLNTNMPRYFIEYYYGGTILGYFGAISYIVIACVNPLSNAINQSTISRMSEYYRDHEFEKFKKVLKNILLVAFFIGVTGFVGSFFFGKIILSILFGNDYAEHVDVLLVMIVSVAFLIVNSTLGSTLTSMRFLKVQPFLGIIWLFKTIIFCYFLAPVYGMMGAAFSILISSFIQAILRIAIIKIIIKKSIISDQNL